jgi:hypothetical protein
MGEFARSLAIARAAARRWPGAEIHFLISRQAPYAGTVPFAVTLLPSSPTLNSPQVIQKILEWRPDVVVFDNAGRSAQLRAAQRIRARIVYISARARQRRKAFRTRWMRCIDEHWIAYPEFIAGKLNWLERLKIDVLKRPMVRFLDVIAARPDPDENPQFERGTYALFVPGGGTGHPGAGDAVRLFVAAARALAAQGAHCVVVGVLAGDTEAPPSGSLQTLAPLPQPQLMQLMRGARILVTNGGSSLLQGIAMGCACIGVPIAKDQPQRIERCVAAGVTWSAPLAAVPMTETAAALWRDEAARRLLVQRAAALHLKDGIEVALQGLERLLTEPAGA